MILLLTKFFHITENISDLEVGSNKNITSDLRKWALQNNVNHKQLTDLLKILKPYHAELPVDSRTLLGTTRVLNSKIMLTCRGNSGKFIYIGILHCLKTEFQTGIYKLLKDGNRQIVELVLNVDGIPIYKSSSTQFWPISCSVYIKGIKSNVFNIAIYVGDSKPRNVSEFLSEFIQEINILQSDGFYYNNDKFYVKLKAVSCDAPARAFLKAIKSHNSLEACEFCTIQGKKINHRMIYSDRDQTIELRNHNNFKNQIHKNHHLGVSPLLSIHNLDIINAFRLDYMHLVCLGTMRRFLNRWFKQESHFCIAPRFRKLASTRMLSINLPNEFNRKARSFQELDRFKATELRTLIMYTGPFVLKNLIPTNQYNHFLLLFYVMRLCCNKESLLKHGGKAIQLIKEFVGQSEKMYENEEPVYNTHSLIHMVTNAVNNKETLEEINCFTFENNLGQLKKLIRSGSLPLEQVIKRLSERNFSKTLKTDKEIYINPKSKNNKHILLKNNKVMMVCSKLNKNNQIFLSGQIYQVYGNAFVSPYPSNIIRVWKVQNLCSHCFEVSLTECECKCIFIEVEGDSYVIALLN